MASNSFMVECAPLLEEVFEQRVATANIQSLGDVATCDAFCRDNRVAFCVARTPTARIDLANALQGAGYLLMETSLKYRRRASEAVPFDNGPTINVRAARADDLDFVLSLIARRFESYAGHYNSDKRLTPEQCVRLYQHYAERSWVVASDFVLIAERDDDRIGAITLRKGTDGTFKILLATWLKQPLGVGRNICSKVILWARSHEARFVTTEVSAANIAIQRIAIQNRFDPISSQHVLHKWFI